MTNLHPPHSSAGQLAGRWLAVLVGVGVMLTSCSRQEPTTARRSSDTPSAAPVEQEPGAAGTDTRRSSQPGTTAAPRSTAAEQTDAATAMPDAGPPGAVLEAELFAADGGTLPQTQDRPALDARFQAKMALLFRAIQEDDPARARSVFFPLVAYRQVKAIAAPDRDYERRLLRAFERDIHAYHRKLGDDASQAQLAAVDVPEAQARWMKPGSEGNKLGYWRVLRSALRIADASGTERKLGVTSLISWRGEWYVVHLNGFE